VDLKVLTYLLYLGLAIPLTFWVGHALHRHGEVFLVDVFVGDERLAHAVNQLLVIGFYLVNLGYVSFFMSSNRPVESGQSVMELLSTKIGGVALIVGAVHFSNVWLLNTYRRRALLRAAGEPPVRPNRRTEIAPA
jgi:uncharacterized membrane protein